MWSFPPEGRVVRVAWLVVGRTCGFGSGLETGMVIVKELADARLLIPSRSREESEKCMAEMCCCGRPRAMGFRSAKQRPYHVMDIFSSCWMYNLQASTNHRNHHLVFFSPPQPQSIMPVYLISRYKIVRNILGLYPTRNPIILTPYE